MKLRAQFTIDVDADDFLAAADHQRRFQDLLKSLKQHYRQAELDFRERRTRPPVSLRGAAAPVRRPTGRLHAYEDA